MMKMPMNLDNPAVSIPTDSAIGQFAPRQLVGFIFLFVAGLYFIFSNDEMLPKILVTLCLGIVAVLALFG